MTLRFKIVFCVLLVGLAIGGFYLRSLARRVFVDPTQHGEDAERVKLSQAALQPNNGTTQLATLYFPAPDEGKIAPESRAITWAQADGDRVRQIILALAEGSHQGLARVLGPSTAVRAVFLTNDGTAFVDLSNDLMTDCQPGIQTETLAVYSIVDSIAINIPAVKRVQFLIQGQEAETLDGHADLTSAYAPDLTRVKSNP